MLLYPGQSPTHWIPPLPVPVKLELSSYRTYVLKTEYGSYYPPFANPGGMIRRNPGQYGNPCPRLVQIGWRQYSCGRTVSHRSIPAMSTIKLSIPDETPVYDWYQVATREAKKEAARRGLTWSDARVIVVTPDRGCQFSKCPGDITLSRVFL